jgi:hypothetical protein
VSQPWKADPTASLARRLGASPKALGVTSDRDDCPDVWELDNGDIAVIGRDLTAHYAPALPPGVIIGPEERLVVIPRITAVSAMRDMPNA